VNGECVDIAETWDEYAAKDIYSGKSIRFLTLLDLDRDHHFDCRPGTSMDLPGLLTESS